MNMRDSFPVIFRYFDLQGDIVVAPLYLKLLENVFVCKTKKCVVKKLQSNEPATSRSFLLFFDFNVGFALILFARRLYHMKITKKRREIGVTR